jgi:hypothetical protein
MDFLAGSPNSFVARREIARRALKRTTYEENPHWADAPIASLLGQGLIEQNDSAHYRLSRYQG